MVPKIKTCPAFHKLGETTDVSRTKLEKPFRIPIKSRTLVVFKKQPSWAVSFATRRLYT